MKKLGMFIVVCLLTAAMSACKGTEKSSEVSASTTAAQLNTPQVIAVEYVPAEPVSSGDVIVEIEDVFTGESNSIPYSVTNLTDRPLTFGDNVTLRYNNNGEWIGVELADNSSWNELGTMLDANATVTGSVEPREELAKLPEGTYRLETDLYDGNEVLTLTGEFQLNYSK